MTDSYAYEAFGEVLAQTGTTENSYLFTGEQFDAGLDQYYLRARYYDQGVGRFTQLDTYQGRVGEPVTLHKYLYANADPVSYTDPTGHFGLASLSIGMNLGGALRINATRISIHEGRKMLHRALTIAIRHSAAHIKREVRRCLSNSKQCKLSVPIVVTGGDMPDTAKHIQDAQAGRGSSLLRSSFLLHYKKGTGRRGWFNSTAICNKTARERFAAKKGYRGTCDEFPYFSTLQGGKSNYPGRVSLRYC